MDAALFLGAVALVGSLASAAAHGRVSSRGGAALVGGLVAVGAALVGDRVRSAYYAANETRSRQQQGGTP